MSLFRSPLVRLLTALCLLMLGAMAPESVRPELDRSEPPTRLEAALTLWLQDNDEDALPQLAEMAREGSFEARQFLKLLHLRPDLWTPWLAALSEDERQHYFKPKLPGGLKYGGWWRRGEEPEPISLLRSKPFEASFVADMTRLIELGEPRLAFVRLAPALKHKPLSEARTLGESRALPAQLSFLGDLASFLKQGGLTENDLRAPALDLSAEARMQMALHYSWAMFLMVEGDFGHEIAAGTMREVITHLFRIAEGLPYTTADIGLANPEIAAKSAWPERRDRTLDWLNSSDEAGHYRGMCTRRCGGEVGRCLLAAYFANGGYTVLYGRQSPTERLIPADRFRDSERALRLPVRRVAMELAAEPDRLAERVRLIRSGSSCFATEVLRDIQRLEETRGE